MKDFVFNKHDRDVKVNQAADPSKCQAYWPRNPLGKLLRSCCIHQVQNDVIYSIQEKPDSFHEPLNIFIDYMRCCAV